MNSAVRAFDVVVIGAGPAGIAAACEAAETGARVALLDNTPWLGGQIWSGEAATAQPRRSATVDGAAATVRRRDLQPDHRLCVSTTGGIAGGVSLRRA